ncbi:MAG: aminomethyl-transferring glycine dehydrogenase subunit GcvPA [Chloroflexota bacterium]|mgnify:CR=1 FL=1
MTDTRKSAHPYIPNSVPEVKAQMLREVGLRDVADLHQAIPDFLKFKGEWRLPLPGLSEHEVRRHVRAILSKNRTCESYLNFLGAGCWQHFVPAVCDEVNQRGEFLTAYTGGTYCDHGKMQALFEYASMVGELVEMDAVCNPTYDWTSAACTSVRMAARITGRNRVLVPKNINPDKLMALRNYAKPDLIVHTIGFDPETGQLDLAELEETVSTATAAVYIENPSYLGVIETGAPEVARLAHQKGALFVVGVDPSSLGVLAPPVRYGADIVCGELQPLGIHMHFGGGLAGFIASSDDPKFVNEYPSYMGSIVPGSRPGEFGFGQVAFERTSYISREQGKEFAGTGNALWGITAAVYMALMGPQGFRELGEGIMQRSHYAASVLSQVKGVNAPLLQAPFFKEFVVTFDGTGKTVGEINKALLDHKIFGGKDLTRQFPELGNSALYCVTEVLSKDDIDRLAAALESVLGR